MEVSKKILSLHHQTNNMKKQLITQKQFFEQAYKIAKPYAPTYLSVDISTRWYGKNIYDGRACTEYSICLQWGSECHLFHRNSSENTPGEALEAMREFLITNKTIK